MHDITVAPKGLDGVIVGDTELSRVDGQKGELIYLGYDIDELANCSFEQVAYLFMHHSLANKDVEQSFVHDLAKRSFVEEDILAFIRHNAKGDHPMATLRTAVSMISGHCQADGLKDQEAMISLALDLIAKTATITAAIARARKGKDFIAPNMAFGFSRIFCTCAMARFLMMLCAKPWIPR